MPSSVLYTRYRSFVGGLRRAPDDPEPLTTRQFGVAIVRVFGLEGKRVKRWVDRKLLWGYCGFKGPDSIVTQKFLGNPKLQHDSD